MSPPVRARVQTIHEYQQFNDSNIYRTCVQDFCRYQAYYDTLTWDDTAPCVQIGPSAAERGLKAADVRFLDPRVGHVTRPTPVPSGTGGQVVEGFDPGWVVEAVAGLPGRQP